MIQIADYYFLFIYIYIYTQIFKNFSIEIPYFKQVVIMATTCDNCGFRTNEVKPGGGIENHGIEITVKVSSPEDLNRDILKVKVYMIYF